MWIAIFVLILFVVWNSAAIIYLLRVVPPAPSRHGAESAPWPSTVLTPGDRLPDAIAGDVPNGPWLMCVLPADHERAFAPSLSAAVVAADYSMPVVLVSAGVPVPPSWIPDDVAGNVETWTRDDGALGSLGLVATPATFVLDGAQLRDGALGFQSPEQCDRRLGLAMAAATR